MKVVPQQYTVQCILSGIKRHFRWYYVYNSQSILSLIVHYQPLDTVVLMKVISFTIITIQYLVLLIAHGMEKRLIVEYLVNQTTMVIINIGVMKKLTLS